MKYCKKWDFHYSDRKDYQTKRQALARKTEHGRKQVKESNRLITAKRYNLTLEQYDKLWEEPWCHICGVHQDQLKDTLHIDHCHTSDKVGKLLCSDCNIMLGRAKDNPQVLIEAIKYLGRER